MFRKDIIAIAKKQGSGWVDYKYKNPESNNVEHKTTYFRAVDGVIHLCGIYKLIERPRFLNRITAARIGVPNEAP